MSKQIDKKLPEQDHLLSVKLSSTSISEVINIISSQLTKNSKLYISTPNPEIVLQAQEDKKLLEAINNSDIAIPDGIGLLWAARQLKLPLKLKRIQGRFLMEELFKVANRKKSKIFLLGASKEVNITAQNRARKLYPNIDIDGTGDIIVDDKGYSDSTKAVISRINKFKPDFLFVAFGAPKQEKWIYDNIKNINSKVILTVGGSLDYFSEKKAYPPAVFERLGLEWLWRLLAEKGHIKRVYNALIRFPLLVLKSKN